MLKMRLLHLLYSGLSLASLSVAQLAAPRYPQNVGNWTGWGGNTYNNRWSMTNEFFSSQTIANIVQHCQVQFKYGLSATPVINGDYTYFPTWSGELVAVNYKTCDIAWSTNVTAIVADFSPITAFQLYCHQPLSRTAPMIDTENGILYFGTQMFALLVALDLSDGTYLGSIQINEHIVAQISMSPTLYEGVVYVGASSEEELAITYEGYVCCTFIGNFGAFKFDPSSKQFTQLWSTSTIGDSSTQGFHGAGLWGSQPAIDSARNQVYIATGNLYGEIPEAWRGCTTTACMPTDVLQDSILALDMATGNINWARQMEPLDGWSFACIKPYSTTEGATICPSGPGPDADFAMAPSFVPAALGPNVFQTDSVIIGEKSGYIYSLSAEDGTLQWTADASPPDNLGGLAWGMAVDDSQAYVVATNYGNHSWILANGENITNGAFGAVNQLTGDVVWQTPMPNLELSTVSPTIVGDLVIAGTQYSNAGYVGGSLIALNKNTGDILLDVQLDVIFHGGISFANEYMLLGTGYQGSNPTEGGSLWVYTIPQ